SVVVERHFGVESDQAALLGDDQRIDLDHGRVEVAESAIAAEDGAFELVDEIRLDAEAERQFASLERLHTDSRVNNDTQNRVGVVRADLLDVHTAGGGCNNDDAFLAAVHDEAEIIFLIDLGAFLNVEARHQLALRTGLIGHEALSEQRFCSFPDFIVTAADLDATGLAAGTGMDLSLYDPHRTADFIGTVGRLLRRICQSTACDRHA